MSEDLTRDERLILEHLGSEDGPTTYGTVRGSSYSRLLAKGLVTTPKGYPYNDGREGVELTAAGRAVYQEIKR
jgi:hypothetical protein